MSTIWIRDLHSIPPCIDGKRTITKGPLINLALLQEYLVSCYLNVENDDHFWVATTRCQQHLRANRLTYAQVGTMLSVLRPGRQPKGDYKKSEWCEVDGGDMYPCDVFGLPFDEVAGQRNNQGLPIYLKFSLAKDGELMLVLVSCHPS